MPNAIMAPPSTTRGRPLLRRILGATIALTGMATATWVVLVATSAITQDRLIYPGAGGETETPVGGWFEVRIPTTDHGQLIGYQIAPVGSRPTIVFAHGNATDYRGSVVATRVFTQAGYGVLIPGWPGYDGNPGRPSEAGIKDAVSSAVDWLGTTGVPRGDVILYGNSIGSGAAIEAAIRHPGIRGLVIVSGLASMSQIAHAQRPWVPTLLLKSKWHNAVRIPEVAAPILIVHGDADELVDHSQGVELARAARVPLVTVSGGHGIAFDRSLQKDVLHRISGWARPIPDPL